ncbi:MAG: DUF4142 domain-containing protein [Saprospiraceae bacterium]|nr:DUF4142 domain-containing protein [Saprospiraceae bacterium]
MKYLFNRQRYLVKPKGSNLVLILILFSILAACRFNQKAEDTKVIAQEQNEANIIVKSKELDALFLVNAAEINLEEALLGRLAQKTSTLSFVKKAANVIEVHHEKYMASLIEISKSKAILIPTNPTDKALIQYNDLGIKSGPDFNKWYCERLVRSHLVAVDIFKKATYQSFDLDIQAWAISTLVDLQADLVLALDCQKEFEENL